MKQVLNLNHKRVALVASFLICGFLANAQTSQQAWQTSKGVQRIANKKMFADEDLKKSHVNAVSVGYPMWALSKGVAVVSTKSNSLEPVKGNIVSSGYPMWTLSKGVARISNSNTDAKVEDENVTPKDPSSLTVSKGVNNARKKK